MKGKKTGGRTKTYLDKKEIDFLFKMKINKNITNLKIAKDLNYTHSTISIFFNKYIGSKKTFNNIKNYITNLNH
jgi:DNA invertase Pin-like site-specific DNA recombinase